MGNNDIVIFDYLRSFINCVVLFPQSLDRFLLLDPLFTLDPFITLLLPNDESCFSLTLAKTRISQHCYLVLEYSTNYFH